MNFSFNFLYQKYPYWYLKNRIDELNTFFDNKNSLEIFRNQKTYINEISLDCLFITFLFRVRNDLRRIFIIEKRI